MTTKNLDKNNSTTESIKPSATSKAKKKAVKIKSSEQNATASDSVKKPAKAKSSTSTKNTKPKLTPKSSKPTPSTNQKKKVTAKSSKEINVQQPKTNEATQNKGNQNNQSKRNNRHSNNSLDAFVSTGKTPKSQIFATKKFPIVNRIIHSNLSQLSVIGQNIAGINGGLLRFRAMEGIEPFEKYIQTLIENVNTSVLTEIAECQGYLAEYKTQGYDFISASEPAICQVKLFNSTSNLLIELFLYLDTLITQINYLEKCNHIPTSEKIKIERQWSMIPRHLNSRVLALKAAIEKKLSVNLSRQNDKKISLDLNEVKNIFAEYTSSKSQLTLSYMSPIPEMQNIFKASPQVNEKLA